MFMLKAAANALCAPKLLVQTLQRKNPNILQT